MKIIPINSAFIERYKNLVKDYTKAMQDEKKQKFVAYVYIILTLFTVSFFGLFAIRPTLVTVSGLNKQYKDDMHVYNSLKTKISALEKLDTIYQEIQPDLGLVYAAIPKSNKIPYLTRQFENIAVKNNVVLSGVDFGSIELYPNNKPTPIYSFTVDLSVNGNESDVNNFIADFINFDRIIGLEKLTSGKTLGNKYGASLKGRVFFSVK